MSKNYLSDLFRKILWNVKYFAPKARDFFLEWAIHFIKEGYMVTEITEMCCNLYHRAQGAQILKSAAA